MSDDRIEAVSRSLGLGEQESADALRREIRTELRDLHPDRNGGDFASATSKERFSELSDALALLDSGSSTSLVPMDTVAPLVTTILEAMEGRQVAAPSGPSKRELLRAAARQEAALRFRVPRYASAGLGAVVTSLWVLPNLVSAAGSPGVANALQASMLGPLFGNPTLDAVFFGVMVYAWIFFGLTWVMEQNDLSRIDWVTTDEARSTLLRRAVTAGSGTVSKARLRDLVGKTFNRGIVLKLLGARDVSPSFLDEVVDQHVSDLVGRGVLLPVEGASLSPRYEVAQQVIEEIA